MLHAMIEFTGRFPHMHRLVEHGPASAISFLVREMPHMVAILTKYLAPALEIAPPVVSGSMTCEELRENCAQRLAEVEPALLATGYRR